MTYYGINPSFVNSPLPLLSDALKRGRRFEIFRADGSVTGEEAPLGPDGWPIEDGRSHGVRLFEQAHGVLLTASAGVRLVTRPGYVAAVWETGGQKTWRVTCAGRDVLRLHGPSLEALRSFQPSTLRTLDWQRTNHRPDWLKPRVRSSDPLQGTDRGMSVELQARAANSLGCSLWWPAPPRFELSVALYETRLEEMLVAIRDTVKRPPILEYGNELWNAGFPVHGWLRSDALRSDHWTWQESAAREIALLKRVADRVFGAPGPLGARPYYLFVGGQLTVPSHLDRILAALAALGVTPDLAGPALYVTPMKAQREEWEALNVCPTQEELRASCFARLKEIALPTNPAGIAWGPLGQCASILHQYRVPYFACYEAGQSLIAGSYPWRRAALEAQKTEWMGDLYREIRKVAEAAGVDLLCWYSAMTDQTPGDARVDVFGLLEGLGLPDLPKARAARGEPAP